MFKDGSGQISSIRLATIGSVVLFIPAFIFLWARISWIDKELADIPSGVIWFLGVLLVPKVLQKGAEVWKEKKNGI